MTAFTPNRTFRACPTLGAKWSFATRRVQRADATTLDGDLAAARPGDLVLAEVTRIGNHKRLQLADGRFSPLWPGDRIVVACADRYAVDQFHGVARLSPEGADLLAGGGIAGEILSRNNRVARGTRLAVLGRLADGDGAAINVNRYALPQAAPRRPALVLAVLGTGMNAGKTAAAAGLVNGFARLGRRVAAIKATGTGSFGDLHEYEAAGAAQVLDFTDAGMASTHRQAPERLIASTDLLLSHAAECDVAVVELADGVAQVETAALLSRPDFVDRFDGTLLAAPEALTAHGALAWLAERGIAPLALTGVMTRAPLAAQDATEATGLPVLCRTTLADPATASAVEARFADLDRGAA
ncbi:hypothetical protein SAMN05444722_3389 [Rhodovulum sp. ES.010]|uniref:hypothetical protein n=1 Tax=Rhodovulum sp. ES.010 TaxID=1882821 RepID=UPI000927EA06|nr:hypothetical protein [Rhodovulum sp. ES.010]SIO54621.1 hypothetical protein SAMN05444722_3389 [Rhodovulum sp. ES.010]